MHRRYQNFSIPTEIMRSVVGISEAGSITKAAKKLGLSQPALSSQIKRIEHAVGGSIFRKSANGSATTELGKLVLTQARKILEANDQLLRLRGASLEENFIRLGICNVYVRRALAEIPRTSLGNLSIYADRSHELAKTLLDGFVDAAIYFTLSDMPPDPTIKVIGQRDDEMTWVRSADFTISPGAPIPLLTWPGQVSHDAMIQALDQKGLVYRIAFSSPDYNARLEAAKAGVGITILPKRVVEAPLIAASDYYLPPIRPIRLMLCTHESFYSKNRQLIDTLNEKCIGS